MSPLTPEIEAKLTEEALERSHQSSPQPRMMNTDDKADRLRLAAELLGNAIDAHEKAGVALRSASRFFVAEFAAAMGANIDPTTLLPGRAQVGKMREAIRPKTFNQSGASNGNDSG